MPLEREAKMQVADHDPVRARLSQVGAQQTSSIRQIDSYFDTEDRSLLAAGQGLRIRRVQSLLRRESSPSRVTFKGGRQQGVLRTREEFELSVSDAESMEMILVRLGFVRVLRFEKRRHTWQLDGCEVALDELPRLGKFVEIEGPGELEVMAVRQKLGLEEAPLLTSSYVAMLSHRLHDRDPHPRDIRF